LEQWEQCAGAERAAAADGVTTSTGDIIARLLIATLLALVIYNVAINRLFEGLTNAYLDAAVQNDVLRDSGLYYDVGDASTLVDRASASKLLFALRPDGHRPEIGEDGCIAPEDRLAYAAYALAVADEGEDDGGEICTATSSPAGEGERNLGMPTLKLVMAMNRKVTGSRAEDDLNYAVAAGLASRPLATSDCAALEDVATVAECLFVAPVGEGSAGSGVEKCNCGPARFSPLAASTWRQSLSEFVPTVHMPRALSSSDAALAMRTRLSVDRGTPETPRQNWIPPLAASYPAADGATTNARLEAVAGCMRRRLR
jgi:hypothetical protein